MLVSNYYISDLKGYYAKIHQGYHPREHKVHSILPLTLAFCSRGESDKTPERKAEKEYYPTHNSGYQIILIAHCFLYLVGSDKIIYRELYQIP